MAGQCPSVCLKGSNLFKGNVYEKKSGKVLKIEVRLTTTLFTASIRTNEYYRHNRYLWK